MYVLKSQKHCQHECMSAAILTSRWYVSDMNKGGMCGTSGVHYVTSQPFSALQWRRANQHGCATSSSKSKQRNTFVAWNNHVEPANGNICTLCFTCSFNSWLCLEAPLKYCGQHAQIIQINWLERHQLTCSCFCCDLKNWASWIQNKKVEHA